MQRLLMPHLLDDISLGMNADVTARSEVASCLTDAAILCCLYAMGLFIWTAYKHMRPCAHTGDNICMYQFDVHGMSCKVQRYVTILLICTQRQEWKPFCLKNTHT